MRALALLCLCLLSAAASPCSALAPDPAFTRRWAIDYKPRERRNFAAEIQGKAWRYREMMRAALKAKGLPPELLYISGIESGFDPHAVSPSGAAGLWQLMPVTARKLGLTVTKDVDERFDPELATRAAVRHIKDLHRSLKDWNLVLAAYNCGEGCVRSAIRRGKPLPDETRRFVAKFHAAVALSRGQSPRRYSPRRESAVRVSSTRAHARRSQPEKLPENNPLPPVRQSSTNCHIRAMARRRRLR